MRHIFFSFLMIFILGITLNSCSRDDEGKAGTGGDDQAIVINGGITTKAVDSSWESGDAIGVTMYDTNYGNILEGDFNKEYVTEQTLGIFNAASTDDIIYFPQDGSSIRLKSYYPYTTTLSENMYYPVDVTDQLVLQRIDLMTAEHRSGFSKTDNEVNLHFYHRLTSLVFNLSLQDDDDFVDLSNCVLSVEGMDVGNTYDLKNDVFLDRHVAGENIIVPLRKDEVAARRQAIVLPRPAGEGVKFQFSTPSGDTYTAIMADTLNLLAGSRYVFNIRFSKNPVIVTATIEPWVERDPQYYETIQVSSEAGTNEGVKYGDVMEVFLQNETSANFEHLMNFTFREPDYWQPDQIIYWEDIDPNPATFRASIISEEALNDTQLPDILIAGEEMVSRYSGVHFTFNHVLSKVLIRLVSSTFSEESIRNATIVLPNYTTGGRVENGEFIYGTSTGNINVDATDPNNRIAIFQPQTVPPQRRIMTVYIDGREYPVFSDRGMIYDPGVAYQMIVRAEETDFTVAASVIDWTTETVELEAIAIGTGTSGGVNVNNGEVLHVYTGEGSNRVPLADFTYYAAVDSFYAPTPIYWESLADPTTFYGYIHRADRYNETQLDDDLVAAPVTVNANNGVDFVLRHAAAQVVVRLHSNNGTFSQADIDAMELILPQYITGGSMVNGLFVPGNTESDVRVQKNVGADGTSAIALIQPQTLTAGTTILNVTSNGRTYSATSANNITFEGGVTTILDVDISKTPLTISATVVDWEEGETITLVPTAIEVIANAGDTDDFFQNKTIYVYKMNTPFTSYSYSYTNGGNGYIWTGGPIYWDDQTTLPLELRGVYSPTGQPTVNNQTFGWVISPNQSSGYSNYDLLTSQVSLNVPQAANFEFVHAVSKVRVVLESGTGVQLSELQGATVRLNNFLLSGTVNLSNMSISNVTGSSTVTPLTELDGVRYTALVMPQQKSVGDDILTLTLSGYPGTPFEGKLQEANLAFRPGEETVITVVVNKTELVLTATLRPWEPGDTGGVIIE